MRSQGLIARANHLFRLGDTEGAAELYRKAKEKYGVDWLDINLWLCERRSHEVASARRLLDPITRVMLENAREPSGDSESRSRLIAQIQSKWEDVSENAAVKDVPKLPADWPAELKLPALPESTNDFNWLLGRQQKESSKKARGLSVVVPVFNRSRILSITLACLVNQETVYPFEVIVVDDGSQEDIAAVVRRFEPLLEIKYVRQKDEGYRLCAVRNLGIRAAQYDWVAIVDCDMAPTRRWVQSYCQQLEISDDWALIGPRKYVDTNEMEPEEFLRNPGKIEALPEVVTNNDVAGRTVGQVSVDWRLKVFNETEDLRLCNTPFRYFSGGNVAFSKKWVERVGEFDEDFKAWGGEDVEFGYRLYRAGCYFKAEHGGLAYHQEPPGKENETDRKAGKVITQPMVEERVPYFYRKLVPIEKATLKKAPLVSIYIPAYNCREFIVECVESALAQKVTDLEVVICDDGSTDGTRELLHARYADHPRVRIVIRENGGIGAASNTAVRHCRGYYIGQLDSDDMLKPDAVSLCLEEFLKDPEAVCVYTTNYNLDHHTGRLSPGYNWPEFSREKIATSMIVHHFRMFTARAWSLVGGFDERITNAVDYDFYLRLSAVGKFKHLNKRAYIRRLHGENTSIKKLGAQKVNHFAAANKALQLQGITSFRIDPMEPKDPACRKYEWIAGTCNLNQGGER